MSKGQLLSGKLLTIVILTVSMVVLLMTSTSFGNVIRNVAKTSSCNWNFAVNAITSLPPECEATYSTLTMKNLSKGTVRAAKRIEEFNAEPRKYAKALEHFPYQEKYSEEDLTLYEYAMDEYIAKRMKSGWDKVWKGKLPIFDDWWNIVDWTFFGFTDAEAEKGRTVQGEEAIDIWLLKVYDPPTFCVLLERIKFGEDIKKKFGDRGRLRIDSLSPWMDNNPLVAKGSVPNKIHYYDNTPYSKYLEDDVHVGLFRQRFNYELDKNYAILYSRVNVYKGKQYAETVLDWLGVYDEEDLSKPINVISLVPYEEIGQRCHVLIS